MTMSLRGLSSMATRHVLSELAQAWREAGGVPLEIESVGGVDAARRVEAGEAFDFVVLASDALARLAASAHVQAASAMPLVDSAVAIAVRAGAPLPDTATEAGLRATVLAARRIAYSTGPSGSALLRLFERWGLGAQLAGRLVQARPGVPVGTLIADGEADLGFQQYSELVGLRGVSVVGGMPAGLEIVTTFSAAVCAAAAHPVEARAVLEFMAAPARASIKQACGMAPPAA